MAEIYQSRFTGPEFDNTVTSSLFGVTVNGNAAPVNNHIAEISIPAYETGTWNPSAGVWNDPGASISNPTISGYAYKSGQYTRIGDLCFVNFYMKFTLTAPGQGYACVGDLPFTAVSSISKQCLTVCDFGATNWHVDPTVTLQLEGGDTLIKLERGNGLYSVTWPSGGSYDIFVAGSGVYKIQV